MEEKRYQQPTKFPKFFAAMKKVLQDVETVVLTDMELHLIVNQELAQEDRVSYSTFDKWKMNKGNKRVEAIECISKEDAAEFRHWLGYSRANQKLELAKRSLDPANKAAYKEHWMMERKFADLKSTPQIQLQTNPTIKIEAGSKEQAALLDNIMNGDTEDVDHEEID